MGGRPAQQKRERRRYRADEQTCILDILGENLSEQNSKERHYATDFRRSTRINESPYKNVAYLFHGALDMSLQRRVFSRQKRQPAATERL